MTEIPRAAYDNTPYLFLWEGKDLSKEPWCPAMLLSVLERHFMSMINDLGPYELYIFTNEVKPIQ